MSPADHFWLDFDRKFVSGSVSTSLIAAGSSFLLPFRKSSVEERVLGVSDRRGTA